MTDKIPISFRESIGSGQKNWKRLIVIGDAPKHLRHDISARKNKNTDVCEYLTIEPAKNYNQVIFVNHEPDDGELAMIAAKLANARIDVTYDEPLPSGPPSIQ